MDCCKHTKKNKSCLRADGKVFKLPRRFTMKQCQRGVRGFSMRSSCAPYNGCKQGGSKKKYFRCISVIDMNNITGVIRLRSTHNTTNIKYLIKGLSDGKHGFHIHKCGDMTKGCASGCEHFNPLNKVHGGPHSKERHAGDLGNITSIDGIAKGSITVNDISCDPKSFFSVVGRMFVVHKDRDDLGLGGDEESLKTGNAGERIACSIIGLIE